MFSRKSSDYVISADITNHLQVTTGDAVTISKIGYMQLQRESAFWRNVAIGGTVTALAFATCGGIGVVGGFGGFGLAAETVTVAGGIIGGTATALGQKAYDDSLLSQQTLETVGFIGKVIEIGQKFMSDLYHVHVEFYIPNDAGGYDTKDVWVDAHHLMKLMTVVENDRRTRELELQAKQAKEAYDAKMLKEHRASFAPENVFLRQSLATTKVDLTLSSTEVKQLQTSLQSAKTQRNFLAALGPFALLLLLL
jgi:hypothetical protein